MNKEANKSNKNDQFRNTKRLSKDNNRFAKHPSFNRNHWNHLQHANIRRIPPQTAHQVLIRILFPANMLGRQRRFTPHISPLASSRPRRKHRLIRAIILPLQ